MNEEKLHRHTLAPMCPADERPCCVGRVMHSWERGWGVHRGSWAALLINHVGTHRRHVLTLMIKHCATRSPWADPAGFILTSVSADGSKKNTHTSTDRHTRGNGGQKVSGGETDRQT